MYASFPAHLARYPEQRINASPEQMEALLSGRSSASDRDRERHEEHIHNVRTFHQSLQGGERPAQGSAPADLPSSRSTLFSALRKNLSELDDIQRYFSRKLTTPTFPSFSEQAPPPRPDERRDSETDSAQLLLRSNRLVGAVNSLISDLHGHRLSGPREITQCTSGLATPSEDHFLSNGNCFLPGERTEPQRGPSEEAGTPQDGGSLCGSPVPQGRDGPGDTLANAAGEIRHGDDGLSPDEGEDEGERRHGSEEEDEEEDEEEQDYEETVIEPRTLNEVTVATDRTSPWTSLLSEPDLGSLQSLEDPEEQRGPAEEEEESGRGCGRSSAELLSCSSRRRPRTRTPTSRTGRTQTAPERDTGARGLRRGRSPPPPLPRISRQATRRPRQGRRFRGGGEAHCLTRPTEYFGSGGQLSVRQGRLRSRRQGEQTS
ncbi:hypothetical protein ANANG_G00240710 [Anguilla anguilla]|uniref:Uncharacterized protein n=1 Tax=Anguilla anguilla TaxID=7936 RepID=A0A9D3RS24_ANGAN|nr:hypothetical protein ANANG_G00240710 [Anguilla anguilla]